jgi:DNA polymerase elongation subunit (family B)
MDEAPIVTAQVIPYDVIVTDDVMNEDTGDKHVNIHLWCLDKESKPWLVRVRDFPMYFYIELPTIVNGANYAWDMSSAEKVIDSLKFMMGDKAPTNWMFGHWQKLYYYMGERKFPMIFVSFKTLEAVRFCTNLLNKPRNIKNVGVVQLKCYEANIDIVRKFFTAKDASFCQWLNVTGKELDMDNDGRISKEGNPKRPIRELSVSYTDIKPIPRSETDAWFTSPRILAFDIETYSDNHKAMPDALVSKHVCNIISCIYYELGNVDSRKRYVIVLGDSKEVSSAEAGEVTVIRVQNETELIHAFANLINELDPEIISGYNIFSYDYPYLNKRRKHKTMDWPIMGRLQKKPTEMSSMVWKSGAYGTNDINILEMEGRLSIDMLPIVKRDYRLDKYSLEFVSQNFLGRGKLDVKPVDMFRAYERQEFIIRYAKQFILARTGEYTKNWDILKTLDMLREASDASPDDIKEIDKIKARYAHALEEVTKIVAYCVQDSDLVVDLFDKLNVWIGLNALSSVVGVTIIQLFTRGQQVRCLSQVYDKASRKGVVLDKRIKDKVFYEGGFVFEPKAGLYDGVICLDFASLYPSIMRAMNICFTTLVPPELYDAVPDSECNIIDVNQEDSPSESKLKAAAKANDDVDDGSDDDSEHEGQTSGATYTMHHYKWVKKNVRYGILPEIQDHLVGSRNIIKKEIIELEDELDECDDPKRLAEIKLLLVLKDKYSNALKVSANSLYGFLGAQEGGVLALIEAAMCITATGRKLINQVNDYVIEKYGAEIVYGDSVTGDTPLFIMENNGEKRIVPIESLIESSNGPNGSSDLWKDYRDSKQIIDVEPMNIQVMTETGFTKIKKYIRHKIHPEKKLFRIKTKYGSVDVTEDHSLVLANGEEISPKDVKIGTELLHNHRQHEYLTQELPFLKDMSEKCIQYRDHLMKGFYRVGKDSDKIISIEELPHPGTDVFVYDLETENHHFAVGPGALVVHNTDSSMIDMHIYDPKACFEAGVKLAEEISGTPEKKLPDGTIIPAKPGLFPPPLKMEFEKAMRMLSIKKKKYAAFLIGKDGEYVREKNKDGTLGEIKILKRGIIVARRDTCKLVHKTYNTLLKEVLLGKPIKEGYDIIFDMIEDLINNRVSVRDNLTIIRSVGASYKADGYFMKVFSDELQRLGKGVQASERVSYTIVRTKEEEEGAKDVKLGLKMRLIEMYEESWNINSKQETSTTLTEINKDLIFEHPDDPFKIPEEPLAVYPKESIDVNYFLQNILQNSLDQLVSIGYGKSLEKIKDKGYTPQYSRKKSVSIETPIKMINAIFEDYMKAGYTMDQIKTMMSGIRKFFYDCFESV